MTSSPFRIVNETDPHPAVFEGIWFREWAAEVIFIEATHGFEFRDNRISHPANRASPGIRFVQALWSSGSKARGDFTVEDCLVETPVVRGADGKGLAEISRQMKDLAGRAREGKLAPGEYQGGTFSISNLGMFGIKEFSAVINPPQGAILAVGMGEQRPLVRDGALAVATVMSCTLSIDHRVVDGATGAQFMAAFKALIEDPLTMLL